MRSEKIRKILSETSDETKESVREYANKKVLEGNEVEKAAEEYANKQFPRGMFRSDDVGYHWGKCHQFYSDGLEAGINWQKERENAELTRTSKELDDMTTKYNELSRKYDDLYRKHKPV